jgi:hypothetical protein
MSVEKEEKEEIKKLFPGYGSVDLAVYLELLTFTKKASLEEQGYQSSEEQLTLARTHALKLATLFGSVDKAKAYLDHFKIEHPLILQPVHDACLFLLPETEAEWNIPIWQSLISREMPNSVNHPLIRMLPFASKIETGAKDKAKIQKAIRPGVEKEFHAKFSKKYDQIIREKAIEKEIWINHEIEKNKSKIKTNATKEFDFKIREILEFPQKLTEEQVNLLKAKKEEAESQKLYSTIEQKEFETFREKSALAYTKRANELQNKDKVTYVTDKLKENSDHINHVLQTKAVEFNEHISLEILGLYASSLCYERAKENPIAASLFFEWGIPEESFNQYLSLKPKDNETYIPNVSIRGEEICEAYKGFTLEKLDPKNPEAAVLGKFTSCCQSLGFQGQPSTVHGITDEKSGFYVLRNSKGVIVSQCWAYRSPEDNNMVFDSVESHLNFRKNGQITVDFFTLLGKKLVEEHEVPRVVVGTGGQTPKTLGVIKPAIPSRLENYNIYSDAFQQRIIADKNIPLFSIYIKNNQTKKNSSASLQSDTQLKDDKVLEEILLDKKSILELCDSCAINNIDLNSIIDIKPSLLALQLPENFIEKRIKLVKEWQEILSDMIYIYDENEQIAALNNIKKLFEKDNDINFNIPHPLGGNAICYAANASIRTKKSALELIKFLVDNGANINAMDSEGRSALHFLIDTDDKNTLLYLIENGANPNVMNRQGQTPLDIAAKYGQWDTVKYLLEVHPELKSSVTYSPKSPLNSVAPQNQPMNTLTPTASNSSAPIPSPFPG